MPQEPKSRSSSAGRRSADKSAVTQEERIHQTIRREMRALNVRLATAMAIIQALVTYIVTH